MPAFHDPRQSVANGPPVRDDTRIVIHFDYDAFYASCFEAEHPGLKEKPLGVRQKQLIVTCNYAARQRPWRIHKLMNVHQALRQCPHLVIMDGENLDRFQEHSTANLNLLKYDGLFTNVQTLGFDEVFIDATDLIDYNMDMLNLNTLRTSFFVMSYDDPTDGFVFDATAYAGRTHKVVPSGPVEYAKDLSMRLRLGSHLADFLRRRLEQRRFTCTAGVATNKLLAKLVGSVNKPCNQTTFVPPYDTNPVDFLNNYEIGEIPGIGHVTAERLRRAYLGRPADYEPGLVTGRARESDRVTVAQVRSMHTLESVSAVVRAPHQPLDLGERIWALIWGVDNKPVDATREFPKSMSDEETYLHLCTVEDVAVQLENLMYHVLMNMAARLYDIERDAWAAQPTRIHLQAREKGSVGAGGNRERNFSRLYASVKFPGFALSRSLDRKCLARRLVDKVLLPMWDKKIQSRLSGRDDWSVNLLNVGVSNIEELQKHGPGITGMLRNPPRPSRPEGAAVGLGVDASDVVECHLIASERPATRCPTTRMPAPPTPTARAATRPESLLDPTPVAEETGGPGDHNPAAGSGSADHAGQSQCLPSPLTDRRRHRHPAITPKSWTASSRNKLEKVGLGPGPGTGARTAGTDRSDGKSIGAYSRHGRNIGSMFAAMAGRVAPTPTPSTQTQRRPATIPSSQRSRTSAGARTPCPRSPRPVARWSPDGDVGAEQDALGDSDPDSQPPPLPASASRTPGAKRVRLGRADGDGDGDDCGGDHRVAPDDDVGDAGSERVRRAKRARRAELIEYRRAQEEAMRAPMGSDRDAYSDGHADAFEYGRGLDGGRRRDDGVGRGCANGRASREPGRDDGDGWEDLYGLSD